MGNFSGTLRPNEIFSALFNMIISQEVFADNISKGGGLVDKARTDGGLYGDTKLYYATDVLKSVSWGNDAEAANLLALNRPKAPECQEIVLDTFRQISLTVDNYLSKRAWSNEGAFASFNSVMLGWIRDTKIIYDDTLYNTFIGITKSTIGNQYLKVVLGSDLTAEERAKEIARNIADVLVEMGDVNREFNDYGYLRKYDTNSVKVIWNSKYVNEIRKLDLPAIFHKDGLMDKFDENVLPKKYFGDPVANAITNYAGAAGATPDATHPIKNVSNTTYTYEPAASNEVVLHVKEECDIPVYDTTDSKYIMRHFFAGDKLPSGAAVKGTFNVYFITNKGITASATSLTIDIKDAFYLENNKIICKMLIKYPPYMSAFEAGTSFFNAKSLSTNHYLTWGHNTLEYLKNYPFITLYEAES